MKTQLLALLPAGLIAGAMALAVTGDPSSNYVAHEWGTFTDLQGADGVQMGWNPQITPDLPGFVYRSMMLGGKASMWSNQRMETPVIYFYTAQPRTVDVQVGFPQGSVTEYFPYKPAVPFPRATGKPALHWPGLQVLPSSPAMEALLPRDGKPSHYYAARATDASFVQIADGAKLETEKFLFYRGTGTFLAPLTVKMGTTETDGLTLQNTGAERLSHLFLYRRTAQGAAWLKVPALAAGEVRHVMLPTGQDAPFEQLAPALRGVLRAEGLYEKEAAAMVQTWEDSWLGERGLRVLYTLPRAFTDRTLPLQLTPTPQQVERVMVARAEIITPETEQILRTLVKRYIATPAAERPAIVEETRALALGRFLLPSMERLWKTETDADFRSFSYALGIAALEPVSPVATRAAAR